MTRRPAAAPGRSELYAWLRDRAEAEAAHPMPPPGNAARLTALRAGDPVDVCAGDLPDWARPGRPTHWWHRATVTAAGVVMFYVDDGRRWLAENGF